MSRRSENIITSINAGNEHYLDCVGREALDRAGNCSQLKGVAHEILFRDKLNTDIKNIMDGKTAVLTKNPTAHAVDLVQMKDGRCTDRFQLKDTTSERGVNDTLSRNRSHQYRSTKLMGTKETTQKYNSRIRSGDKTMKSTGISSNRTGRIADNAGVKCRDKNTFVNNMKDIGSSALDSFGVGAGIAGVTTAVNNFSRYQNGEISGSEFVGEIVVNSAKSASKSAVKTATALTLKESGKALGKSIGSESMRKLAGSNVGTAVAFAAVDIGYNAIQCARGEISGSEFAKSTATTAAGAAGGYGGALGGAALGSAICPGIGTAIGGLIGGVCGSISVSSVVDGICSFFD